jgi:hypothetical protein
MTREIALNDVALHSPWPSRLLGLAEWRQRSKTPEEIIREFNDEKWAAITSMIDDNPGITVESLDFKIMKDREIAYMHDGRFFVAPWSDVHNLNLDIYAATLAKCLEGSPSALVELGAGYGSVILNLARRISLRNHPLFAGDLTTNGTAALKRLAANGNVQISAGLCDLRTGKISGFEIPPNSVIFTCFAAFYIPELAMDFVSFLTSFKPKAVVHFEPCYEHHSDGRLFSLLCQRYIQLNDYNRNMISVLQEAERIGLIEILEERPNVAGANPLLPTSILTWRPIRP